MQKSMRGTSVTDVASSVTNQSGKSSNQHKPPRRLEMHDNDRTLRIHHGVRVERTGTAWIMQEMQKTQDHPWHHSSRVALQRSALVLFVRRLL